MPKLCLKNLKRRERWANLHKIRKPRVKTWKPLFAQDKYRKTGLELYLDLDNTILPKFKDNETDVRLPKYLPDLLHYCKKVCAKVAIFTLRKRTAVEKIFSDAPELLSGIQLYTHTNTVSIRFNNQARRIKPLVDLDFKEDKTVIIDDNEEVYLNFNRKNLMVANVSQRYKTFYREIVKFLTVYTPRKDLRLQIREFCEKSKYFRRSHTDYREHTVERYSPKLTRAERQRIKEAKKDKPTHLRI